MLDSTLPKTVVMRKMVIRNGTLDGVVEISSLPRLSQLLVDNDGRVQVYLEFEADDQRRDRIQGKISANINVYCQRCLESMPLALNVDIDAAAVISDEKAQQLPRDIDPVMLDEEELKIYELVEDELLLALPIVTMHDEPCGERQYFSHHSDSSEGQDEELGDSEGSESVAVSVEEKQQEQDAPKDTRRPFEGLADLLKDQ